ncbi:hypothetical protein EV121DRAFT_211405 [Schizophyllum commune]
MHAVLKTPELRHEIFSYLDCYLPPKEDLTVLARTCRDFHETALSVLWKELEDVDPVLSLLPEGKRLDTTFSSHLSNDDVARLHHYTIFIQSLSLDFGNTSVAPKALMKVIIACDDQNMFPNLRQLHYYGPSAFRTSCALPCVHLEWVSDASTPIDATMELTLLHALKRRRIPLLTSLALYAHDEFGWSFTDLLSGWDHLEDLSLTTHMDTTLMSTLFSLPRLCSLHIRSGRLKDRAHTFHGPPVTAPTTLGTLKLHFWSVSCAAKLIAASRGLELVDFRIWQVKGTRALDRLIRSMHQNGSKHTLRRLEITRRRVVEGPPTQIDDDCVAAGTFQLLFDFHNLVSVTLHVPASTICLRDADLRKMALAWPHIQRLDIHSARGETPACTLLGLLAFSHHCEHLEELAISVNACETNIPEGTDVDCAQFRLRNLTLYRSPISGAPAVASFLSRFFPCIERIRPSPFSWPDPKHAEQWQKVDELLPIFAKARLEGVHRGGVARDLRARS